MQVANETSFQCLLPFCGTERERQSVVRTIPSTMSQFLTVNKIVGHMIVKQGVFVVKVIHPYTSLKLF